MAKWVNSLVQDNGLNQIKNSATKMVLISAYTAGDSYATVNTNTVASVTMTSADYTLAGAAGAPRTLTVASGKTATATATASGTPDLHVAFTNGTDTVYWVTDETSNQPITSGNTVTFTTGPVFTVNQPT